MRDNFVNDIGDYAKYALLRALATGQGEPAAVRLGVVWYLTDHEVQNGDGRKRAHLEQGGWDTLDPELLAAMRQIEPAAPSQDQLNVGLIESSGILPADTAYFSTPVPGTAKTPALRAQERQAWFEEARKAMAGCNLVFLDPDNGLQVPSAPVTSAKATLYATVEEISTFLNDGAAVVIYQHGRRMAWEALREEVGQRIAAGAGRPATVRSLLFRASGVRAFFCISASPGMTEVIEAGLARIQERTKDWARKDYLVVQ